jgi:myo-inositol 2-dehydrogenase/D-chiro-inositol 1-dehydrogenase
VYDPDGERAAAFAAASGATVCGSVGEVLAGCDAVFVCTWTAEHPPLVAAALEEGVPVFCEKPLATDLAGAQALTDMVLESGVVNQVGLVLRRSPAFQLARELVADESSGRVVSFVFRDDQYLPTGGMYASTWRGDREKAGAGTLIEHSIHDVDVIEAVIGPVEAVSGDQAFLHGLDGIEDVVAATLTLADGGIGSLTSVWHDIHARPSLRRLEVFCERRQIVVEGDWFGPVSWIDQDGAAGSLEGDELLAETARRGLDTEIPEAAFVRAVRQQTAAWPDVTVALRAHQVVEGIYEACRTGHRVTVRAR